LTESTGAKPNIYLIGLSGTGKTRSGRRVAELLGWPFVEMDGVIEDRAGKSIPRIFEENGEKYFRDLESTILKEVAERGIMKATGLIVRLSASPEVIHQRLISSSPQRGRTLRPLLGDDAPIEKLRNMLLEREEAYSVANATVDTERKSHDEVAEAISTAWHSSGMADTSD
jgi:shikimate kinase